MTVKNESAGLEMLKANAAPVDDPKSRLETMAAIVGSLNTLSPETLFDVAKEVASQVASIKAAQPDTSSANKATISAKEEVESVFEGTEITESAKEKITSLFEAAVNYKVGLEVARIESEKETQIDEELETIVEELVAGVDAFLDHAAEKWLKDNEVAIESTIRAENAEEIIAGMKELFSTFNIDLPAEKVDAADAAKAKMESLEAELADAIREVADLKKSHETADREALVAIAAEGLALTQADKFSVLAESLDFDGDADKFLNKLKIVREKFYPVNGKGIAKTLDESVLIGIEDDPENMPNAEELDESVDPTVAGLAKLFTKNMTF